MKIAQPIHFTSQNLEELFKRSFELENQRKLTSDTRLIMMDQAKEKGNKVKTAREGREVNEEYLWEEVFTLGLDSDAGETLEKMYPDQFANERKTAEMAFEMEQFASATFGVNYKAWTFADMVRVFYGVAEHVLRENGIPRPVAPTEDKPTEDTK